MCPFLLLLAPAYWNKKVVPCLGTLFTCVHMQPWSLSKLPMLQTCRKPLLQPCPSPCCAATRVFFAMILWLHAADIQEATVAEEPVLDAADSSGGTVQQQARVLAGQVVTNAAVAAGAATEMARAGINKLYDSFGRGEGESKPCI